MIRFLPGSIEKLNNYFNTAAFQPARSPLATRRGTIKPPRDRGQASDLSIIKNFEIHEQIRLQFRAESLPPLNHPQFRLPIRRLGRPVPRHLGLAKQAAGHSVCFETSSEMSEDHEPHVGLSETVALLAAGTASISSSETRGQAETESKRESTSGAGGASAARMGSRRRSLYPRVFTASAMISYPLGGIGAAATGLGWDSQLRDWEIF